MSNKKQKTETESEEPGFNKLIDINSYFPIEEEVRDEIKRKAEVRSN